MLLDHFMAFSTAVHFSVRKPALSHTSYAHDLLWYFIKQGRTLYGQKLQLMWTTLDPLTTVPSHLKISCSKSGKGNGKKSSNASCQPPRGNHNSKNKKWHATVRNQGNEQSSCLMLSIVLRSFLKVVKMRGLSFIEFTATCSHICWLPCLWNFPCQCQSSQNAACWWKHPWDFHGMIFNLALC